VVQESDVRRMRQSLNAVAFEPATVGVHR
jgi:hypothetical protein